MSTANIDFANEIVKFDRILRPYATNLTKNKEETEDLLQDTYYRAIANKEKFVEGTNIKAWLFTIMKNIFINNYRRNQKRGVVLDNSENGTFLENVCKDVVKNEGDRAFMREHIKKAIEGVSKDFTEPFLMYFEGFKYQEIAEQLDLPLGTVKSRIFFARKEIQSRLKKMGIENSSAN
ncbi:MAG: RNA polymerase sigma factor [Chitinophagales bacterium]|nr:RNA polymerase sigma factor [Chitinophagales bacterium]